MKLTRLLPLCLALLPLTPATAAEEIKLSPFMIGLSVVDIDKVTGWYADTLGFKVTLDAPLGNAGGKLRWIEAGSQRIELLYIPNSAPGPVRALPPAHGAVRGYTHLTMEVPDLDAAMTELAVRGVKPAVGPVSIAALKVKVLFIRDPEGNMVELLQRLPE